MWFKLKLVEARSTKRRVPRTLGSKASSEALKFIGHALCMIMVTADRTCVEIVSLPRKCSCDAF
jgi:hypothetical protein